MARDVTVRDADTDIREDRPVQREQVAERQVGVNEAAQRSKYGGFNFGAAFFGWLVAAGLGSILLGLLAGASSGIAFTAVDNTSDLTNNAAQIGIFSGIALLVVLMIAYYAGGYVAGRMSRFDGARQGFGVWIMGIIITAILGLVGALFGAKYNVLEQLHLPHIPVNEGSITTGGIIALLLSVLLTVLAAILGGKLGERYHRKVDRAGL